MPLTWDTRHPEGGNVSDGAPLPHTPSFLSLFAEQILSRRKPRDQFVGAATPKCVWGGEPIPAL